MTLKVSKRKTAPPDDVLEARRTWGGRLLVELNCIRKTPEWLGEQVGYSTPSSMRQVINGHQGISLEIYNKILEVVPEMRGVEPPPMNKDYQGEGAPGPHKQHDYPKLGSLESRRPK